MEYVKTQDYTYNQIVRRLGYFRVFYMSLVQFNSICFRIVLGFLSGVLLEGVAIVTAIEFFLNGFLEVPMGYLSDRFGRGKASIVGICCFGIALVFCFFAIEISGNPSLAWSLLVAQGIFLGLGKPLLSGSIEGFYQSNLLNHENEDSIKKKTSENSLLISSKFGIYVPIITIIIAFATVYIFLSLQIVHYSLLIGGLLYFPLALFVYSDLKKFGDNKSTTKYGFWSEISSLTNLVLCNRELAITTSYKFLGLANLCVLLGYCMISIGRELQFDTIEAKLAVLASLMMGYMGFGWLAKGTVLPKIAFQKDKDRLLVWGSAVLISVYSFVLIFRSELNLWSWMVLLFFIGLITQIAMNGMSDLMTNRAMKQMDVNKISTILSIQNIPGFLFVALYCIYLAIWRDGAPTVHEAFVSLIVINFLILFQYFLCEGILTRNGRRVFEGVS